MDHRHFDRLSKAVAAGTSRRQVLDLLGITVLGGLLDTLTGGETAAKTGHHRGTKHRRARAKSHKPSKGKAAPKNPSPSKPTKCTPNKKCAQWCAQVFGAGTPLASQCTSAANKC